MLSARLRLCSCMPGFLLILSYLSGSASMGQAQDPKKTVAENTKTRLLFDGKSLREWHTVSKFDFAGHGKVAVIDGVIDLAKGDPGTAISFRGKFPKDQYEVSLQAQRYAGDDFFCGMTFPVGKEYCTLIFGGWGGSVIGLSNIDNQSAVENETTSAETFKLGQWYNIRLRVTSKAIQVWLNNESIIKVNRDDHKFSIWWEQEPVRPFGIATWNTSAKLRQIELQLIAP